MKDDSDEIDALAALSSVSNSLSTSFPLPFRILVLVSLGAFCWATNLHVLHLLGIDTAVVLDIRSLSSPNEHVHPSKLYLPVYQLAACLVAWTGVCWVVGFQVIAGGNGEAATGKAIAALSLFLAGVFLFLPAERLKKSERMLLIRSLKRTVTDSIFRPVPFCDVILADILTSFAKVLAGFWVCTCSVLFINRNEDDPVVVRWKDLGVPLITALPYLFRLRQCIAEYVTTSSISPALPGAHSNGPSTLQIPGNGHAAPNHLGHHGHQPSIFVAPTSTSSTPAAPRKRALFNALKYSTAFPVIILSAMQSGRNNPYHHPEEETIVATTGTTPTAYFSSLTLFRLWVLSVAINSLYSFWWDVTNDWGLHLLRPTFTSKFPYISPPFGGTYLRRTMLLPDSTVYVLVVALDVILRFTWSLKLSPHLHSIHEIELGIFLLEALEVLRRWMWVYVRVEWEAVRKGGDALEERMRSRHSDSDLSLSYKAGLGKSPPISPQLPGASPAIGSAGLDRRVSAGHRKGMNSTKAIPQIYADDLDDDLKGLP